MKTVLINLHLVSVIAAIVSCQDIRWRWLGGSTRGNQEASPENPGPRSGGAVFINENKADNSQFYVFGGLKYDAKTKKNILMNDLWVNEKDPHNSEPGKWTLIHPGTVEKKFKGLKHRDEEEVPQPRQLAAACGYTDVMIVIFGGFGERGTTLGDTWIYYIKKKQWQQLFVSDRNSVNSSVSPPPRFDAATWCTNDKMFIFGGIDSSQTISGDMWSFSVIDLEWTESASSKRFFPISDIKKSLYPLPRNGAVTWASRGLLYLFAGNGQNKTDRHRHLNTGYLSDLWSYNISKDIWKFITGPKEKGKAGTYDAKGHHDYKNNPGCRRGAASFLDTSGNLWLFGGEGADTDQNSVSVFKPSRLLADLWHFNTKEKKWAFMGGREKGDVPGKYKSKDKYNSGSEPGSRCEMTFAVSGNTLLIYGGVGHDAQNQDGLLSDFWEIDCHNYVVYYNSMYPGTLFMMVFLGLGMICLASVSFLYVRKFYNKPKNGIKKGYKAEYSPLTADTDP